MIETISGMPEGTIGFMASGEVTREDYRDVLVPALREAAEGGAEMRLLFVIGPEFETYDPGALFEDAKTGLDLEFAHRAKWRRCAVVTDVRWIRRAINLFGFMAPGELRCMGLNEVAAAREWIAARD